MPDFHYVAFRAFAHATEDEAKVREALRLLAGDAEVRATNAEGSHGNPIVILEASVERTADVRAFWRRVAAAGLVPRLREELDRRLDEGGMLFLRFAKQAAALGRMELAGEDEDAVQVRAKAASYPASREAARAVVARVLGSLAG